VGNNCTVHLSAAISCRQGSTGTPGIWRLIREWGDAQLTRNFLSTMYFVVRLAQQERHSMGSNRMVMSLAQPVLYWH
jgi:hypothetical protein